MKNRGEPSFVVDQKTGTYTVSPREKLLQRLPPKLPRVEALREIHMKLALATEFFDHHGDGGRYGVYQAILDVVQYFDAVGIPRATLKPLSAVAAAIADADRGTESPIFKPDRGPGKPPTSVGQLEFDGHLATITECCILHCKAEGMRPYVEKGCQMAASMINARWGCEYSKAQLRELRERVQQKLRGSPDRILLDIAKSSEVAQRMPLAWAKSLLKHDWVAPPPKFPDNP